MTEPKQTYQPGDTLTLPLGTGPRGPITMTFCYMPPCPEGFWMGSRDGEPNEQPVHRVIIPNGFWLGQTPVTEEQYGVWEARFDIYLDSLDVGEEAEPKASEKNDIGNPRYPFTRFSWGEATRFCDWLIECLLIENLFPSQNVVCRLPYEAEWEYACRAGASTDFYNGDGEEALLEVGWCDGDLEGQIQRVGLLSPNLWGLYDMHGNVWEWCADRWDANAYRRRWDGITAEETYFLNERYGDQKGDSTDGEYRVLRGGSWNDIEYCCRSACRLMSRSQDLFELYGMRVCLTASTNKPDKSGQ
jgi:eukaryotic-like serine/threonine-protein kinase